MAPDAVVGLVERAGEIRSRICKREPGATTDMVKRVDGIARAGVCLHGNQVHRIDPLGRLEQHAVAMLPSAFARMRGPCRESLGDVELCGVRGLVRLPRKHRLREPQLVESPAEHRGDLGLQRGTVERRGHIRLVLEHRAPLHELSLHAEEGRQLMMAVDQVLPLLLDPEEPCHEAIEMRRGRDQEVGFVLVGDGGRIRARGAEARVEAFIGRGEPAAELPVEPCQRRGIVEVFEGKAKGGRESAGSCMHRRAF